MQGVDDPFGEDIDAEDAANNKLLADTAAKVLKAAQDQASKLRGHPGYRGMLVPAQIPAGGYYSEPGTLERVGETLAVPGILMEPFEAFNKLVAHFDKTHFQGMEENKAPTGIDDEAIDYATEVAMGVLGGTAFRNASKEGMKLYRQSARRADVSEMVTKAPNGNYTVMKDGNVHVFPSKADAQDFAIKVEREGVDKPLGFFIPDTQTKPGAYLTHDGWTVQGPGVLDGNNVWQTVSGFKDEAAAKAYIAKLKTDPDELKANALNVGKGVTDYIWEVKKGGKDHKLFSAAPQADKYKAGNKEDLFPSAELSSQGDWLVTVYSKKSGEQQTLNFGDDKEAVMQMLLEQKDIAYVGPKHYFAGKIANVHDKAKGSDPDGMGDLDSFVGKNGKITFYQGMDGGYYYKDEASGKVTDLGKEALDADNAWADFKKVSKGEKPDFKYQQFSTQTEDGDAYTSVYKGTASGPNEGKFVLETPEGVKAVYDTPDEAMTEFSKLKEVAKAANQKFKDDQFKYEEFLADNEAKFFGGDLNKYMQGKPVYLDGKATNYGKVLYKFKDDPEAQEAIAEASRLGINHVVVGGENGSLISFTPYRPGTPAHRVSQLESVPKSRSTDPKDIPSELVIRNAPEGARKVDTIGHDEDYQGPVILFHGRLSRDPQANKEVDFSRLKGIGVHSGTMDQADQFARADSHSESWYDSMTSEQKARTASRVMPTYIEPRKVLTVENFSNYDRIDSIGTALHKAGHTKEAEKLDGLFSSGETVYDQARKVLDDLGYDALKYWNTVDRAGWSYVVWRPGVQKSLTDPGEVLFIPAPLGSPGQPGERKKDKPVDGGAPGLNDAGDAPRYGTPDPQKPTPRYRKDTT